MLRVRPGKGQIFSIIGNKNPGLKEETRVSYFRVLEEQVTSTSDLQPQVFLSSSVVPHYNNDKLQRVALKIGRYASANPSNEACESSSCPETLQQNGRLCQGSMFMWTRAFSGFVIRC